MCIPRLHMTPPLWTEQSDSNHPSLFLITCVSHQSRHSAACESALGNHERALRDADDAIAAAGDADYLKAHLRRSVALSGAVPTSSKSFHKNHTSSLHVRCVLCIIACANDAVAATSGLGRHADAVVTLSRLRGVLPGDVAIADGLNAARRLASSSSSSSSSFVDEVAGPVVILNASHFGAVVKSASLALVDFTATWCGPCRNIAPVFHKISLDYPAVHCLKVDVDAVQEVAASERVSSMPTFKVFRYGVVVDTFSGADPGRLTQVVAKWAQTV